MTNDTWNPRKYNENSNIQFNNAFEFFDKAFLNGHENIMDIGCGDGKISSVIASWVPKGSVVGIDNSQAMINYAEKNYRELYDNLSFIHCDATRIKLEKKFEIIVSLNCIHWVNDQVGFFNAIKNHLKTEGHFYAVFYIRTDNLWKAIEKTANLPRWIGYFMNDKQLYNYMTPSQYASILEDVGLQNYSLSVREKVTKMDSIQSLKKYVSGWLPHLAMISDNLHIQFLDDFAECYLDINNQSFDLFYRQINLKVRQE